MKRRSIHIVLNTVLAAAVLAYGAVTFAQEMGITGLTRKNPNPSERGCTCHGTFPTPSVQVALSGPDTLAVGLSGVYMLTINGGPAIKGGTNIATSGGTLAPVSASLKLFQSELTHTSPQFFDAGQVSFQFSYTAPSAPGTQTLFANGNSANGNGTAIGDAWNFAPDKQVTIVNPPTVVENEQRSSPRSFLLHQNYPNPFNPVTNFEFRIADVGLVQLSVYNLIGYEVATVLNEMLQPGTYTVQWNAGDQPSGVYIYRLSVVQQQDGKAGNFVETRRMILLK